jgi:hypothetical protein
MGKSMLGPANNETTTTSPFKYPLGLHVTAKSSPLSISVNCAQLVTRIAGRDCTLTWKGGTSALPEEFATHVPGLNIVGATVSAELAGVEGRISALYPASAGGRTRISPGPPIVIELPTLMYGG